MAKDVTNLKRYLPEGQQADEYLHALATADSTLLGRAVLHAMKARKDELLAKMDDTSEIEALPIIHNLGMRRGVSFYEQLIARAVEQLRLAPTRPSFP